MSVRSPRLGRVAILAVSGAAALSVAACSSTSPPPSGTTSSSTVVASSTTAPTTAPTTTSSRPAPGGEPHVSGLIASVANNSAQVTQKSGKATVNFGDSTKVTEITRAALSDVTPGSCVSVRTTHESRHGQPTTAESVDISPAVDGKCLGKESPPSSTPPSPSTPTSGPSPTSSPPTTTRPSPSPSTPPGRKSPIVGTVASVSGNTINITSTDPSGNASQTAVTVNDKTKYSKEAPANIQAITAGKCMTAKGTKDSGSGALQATTIELRAATNGKCEDHDR
jgi:hypothetical protein